MATRQLATRIEEEQERAFRENTRRLGTNPADAMRMFIAAFNECRGFPYDVRISALAEAEPFSTEEEATDFVDRYSMRMFHEAR
jgi:DNA-damage-inducible protein J